MALYVKIEPSSLSSRWQYQIHICFLLLNYIVLSFFLLFFSVFLSFSYILPHFSCLHNTYPLPPVFCISRWLFCFPSLSLMSFPHNCTLIVSNVSHSVTLHVMCFTLDFLTPSLCPKQNSGLVHISFTSVKSYGLRKSGIHCTFLSLCKS